MSVIREMLPKIHKSPYVSFYRINLTVYPKQEKLRIDSTPPLIWTDKPTKSVKYTTEIIELQAFGYGDKVEKPQIFQYLNNLDDIKSRLYDAVYRKYNDTLNLIGGGTG